MSKDRVQENKYERNFLELKSLIQQRQAFEATHPFPPYSLYKTDFNFMDVHGNALLHYAAAMGDKDKIDYCLNNQANINLKNEDKESAISIALENGHLEVVDHLFQKKANCNFNLSSYEKDKKLLAWCSEKIKKALDESFPNPAKNDTYPSVKNQFFGYSAASPSALERAAEIGEIEFIKKAMKGYLSKGQEDLMVVAARNGQLETVEFLYKNKANINSKKPYENTALIEAVKERQTKVIDFLLEKKVDVNQMNHMKQTALTYAILNSDEETVIKLVNQSASISDLNVYGDNLAHIAVNFHCKIIKELLTIPGFKELVTIKNIYGFTPLDLAIQNKQDAIIQLLDPNCDLEIIKNNLTMALYPPLSISAFLRINCTTG